MSQSRFEAALKQRIADEIDRLTDIVIGAAPAAIKDYSDYRHNAGQISALRRVIEDGGYCDEVNSELNKE
jgi:hypothetical protein